MDINYQYQCFQLLLQMLMSESFKQVYSQLRSFWSSCTNLERSTASGVPECSFCKMKFNTVGGLNKHFGKMHNLVRSCKCETCGKYFKHQNALKFHEKQVHLKLTRATCQICGKVLYNKYELAKHINKHS